MERRSNEVKRILVVDDDAAIRTQLRWALSGEYDVSLAASPAEALELAERERPGLVTLDLSLLGHPGEGEEGLEILPALKAMDPFLKVVIVTASDNMNRASRALALGAFDYYVKPIDLDELRVLIARAFKVQEIERYGGPTGGGEAIVLGGMVGECEAMRAVFGQARRAAESTAPVLIVGEPGVGRETLAGVIHRISPRTGGPFEVAVGGTLAEAFARAAGGTLLLPDVSVVDGARDGLGRYLREGATGDGDSAAPDVRVIMCTDAVPAAGGGGSRRDSSLAERLCDAVDCHVIALPPLRDRGRDVVLLAGEFARRIASERGRSGRGGRRVAAPAFTRASVRALMTYDWPGNIPELINRVRHALATGRGGKVTPDDLGLSAAALSDRTLGEARSELERDMVTEALRRTAGNVSRAARAIGVSRPTMYDLLRKFGVDPAEFKDAT